MTFPVQFTGKLRISCLTRVRFLGTRPVVYSEGLVFHVGRESRVCGMPYGYYSSPDPEPEGLVLGTNAFNAFREWLAELFEYPCIRKPPRGNSIAWPHLEGAQAAYDGPFIELLRFSDREGCLMEPVCQKLAEDFAKYWALARDSLCLEQYKQYLTLKDLLDRAACNQGCLQFQFFEQGAIVPVPKTQ